MKNLKSPVLVVLVGAALSWSGFAPCFAATLGSVPMQGGMIMPMVMYSAANSRIQVTLGSTIPQLTPLLVSNPGDSFDPADPWFDCLDPSRQGLSFSRRYGFMWDGNNSDPLPGGTEVWIRNLASSSELGFYRYSSSSPKQWQPIFGTTGATNGMSWDRTMFHPAVTAPPGTNTFSATFQAYLVDTGTGQEVPGSASLPFVFNFTDVPDGRPALSIAQNITQPIVIAWSLATATNWVLVSADTIPASNWTRVTNVPVVVDGGQAVILDGSAAKMFFRMTYIP